jgi:UDP-N-acetylmuramoylalanine--D-glutamate ligase
MNTPQHSDPAVYHLEGKRVLVVGLGASGRAAAELLRRRGAQVVAIDSQESPALRRVAEGLQALGAQPILSATVLPEGHFDLAVISPGVAQEHPILEQVRNNHVPLIGEFELGYQQSFCLNVSVSGTNGKTTTTELVERMLTQAGMRAVAAGNIGLPVCSVAERSRELDYLVLEVSSFQLELCQFFRPTVAVLLNITPDHLDRYASLEHYRRAKANLFRNQQPFDWAIVQSEALAQLRSMEVPIPSKLITFSANNRRADLYYDRGLLVSRLPDWTGPLLDLSKTRLRGPHNAENLLAALAVGRVLRISLDQMVESLQTYPPPKHRCELVAEHHGVRFVNDSKATNLDATQKAILSLPHGQPGEPNVWLIAGGQDKGFDFHDIGPLLSQRVKGAFLLGQTRERIRAAWSLFTPCTLVDSLLEAVVQAAHSATRGDVVLLSPACSSFDMFQNYQHRGEVFRQAVDQWIKTQGGSPAEAPSSPSDPGGTGAGQQRPTT